MRPLPHQARVIAMGGALGTRSPLLYQLSYLAGRAADERSGLSRAVGAYGSWMEPVIS